ncbi:hypothetical protein CPB84DRAFT_1743034 [Gymnopilus junonius]|uniref:Uncharacterized protein n=1 Tax=Gymnopilus junonius TaxID=109634 RepID=A0A9P5TSQ5_GYMJU|nr:hypothetical protein CPB84DRAFT_1743034 [Gymnopilus junonius]
MKYVIEQVETSQGRRSWWTFLSKNGLPDRSAIRSAELAAQCEIIDYGSPLLLTGMVPNFSDTCVVVIARHDAEACNYELKITFTEWAGQSRYSYLTVDGSLQLFIVYVRLWTLGEGPETDLLFPSNVTMQSLRDEKPLLSKAIPEQEQALGPLGLMRRNLEIAFYGLETKEIVSLIKTLKTGKYVPPEDLPALYLYREDLRIGENRLTACVPVANEQGH